MYEQSARRPSRKLWQKKNVQPEHRKSGKKQWHEIESPQFVAFSNLPEIGDCFFDKVAAIVSTPKPNFDNGRLPDFFQKENTLVASSNNDPLSGIKHVPPEEARYIWYNGNEECREEYVIHDGSYTMEKQGRKENCAENTNKLNNNDDRNYKIKSNANENAQSINKPKKPTKKNTEIWKKPPFMPFLPKKSLVRPKAPYLHTALRAQERKRFENIIKEKETQREQARQVELAALKKQEEKEIAQLRKQTVHKAQPIRHYKMCVPKTGKRPLTDATSPLASKRSRRA